MTKLTPHAKSALDTLAEKQLAYTIARATIEAELKNELIERLSSFKSERDVALYQAGESGVPRTKLGKAIGTSNYRTVQEILADAKGVMPEVIQENIKWSISLNDDATAMLRIFEVGPGSVSGSAVVSVSNGELRHESGDAFVVPQVYRNGFAEEIISKIGE